MQYRQQSINRPAAALVGACFLLVVDVLPLEAAASRKLLINFQRVEFMSSMMIGHIVRLNKQCKTDKTRLKLCNIAPEILEVFTITKLNKILDICEDEAKAIESFKNPRGWFG